MDSRRGRRSPRPERVLALGFLALILAGTVVLNLPFASADGRSIGLFDALFTATSAVCVTGLVVVDTGTAFSLPGQAVLLVLIQFGGLGFMIFATLIMLALGRRITLRDRVLICDAISAGNLSGLAPLAAWYGLLALIIELAGAALLAVRFVPAFGWGRGLWYAVFHAVSAFCNAGFDMMGSFASLTCFSGDPLVLLTIAGLIILGGLGFSVMLEVLRRRGFMGRTWSLHARVVVVVTLVLLVAGTVFYMLAEWHNPRTLGMMSPPEKVLNAFFQSATMRTAGFNSIPLASMTEASKLMSAVLMFVGASPASTGGGVKTTTVSVLVLIVLSVVRGREHVNAFGKRLAPGLMRRAVAILFIYLAILLGGTMLLTLLEKDGYPFLDLLFEAASALATVGVSSIGTPRMNTASRIVLILMMYFGRVGPLTLAFALAKGQEKAKDRILYPEESIIIG